MKEIVRTNGNSNKIPDTHKTVKKPWGKEELLEINDKYVLKRITMFLNERCSLQYHEKKKETIFVLQGKLFITSDGTNFNLGTGDYMTINPKVHHRMKAMENSTYLEASTPELNDVIRLEDDYKRRTVKMEIRPKTIFCDIDGLLIYHSGDITKQHLIKATVLPGVVEKWAEWDRKGYKIILTTGRRESTRAATEKQLSEAGIFYDHLVMGVSSGVRVLINDKKPNGTEPMALAFSPDRNCGIKDVDV